MAAIKGKITGFNLLGKPDIQTTAEATKEETVTCKLFCKNSIKSISGHIAKNM
jgi:hypothetical protein